MSHLYIKTIITPRQARDKHREKRTVFPQVEALGVLPTGRNAQVAAGEEGQGGAQEAEHNRLAHRRLATVRKKPFRLLDGANTLPPEETRSFLGVFPMFCPEPVLVKRSFLYRNGSKRPFTLWRHHFAMQNGHHSFYQAFPMNRSN